MTRIYLSPPDIRGDELEMLASAVEGGWIAPAGPDLAAFEHELGCRVGVANAVALSSGTAALHLALHALDVGAGDDVIVPSMTFVASANVVTYVGARPVFIDSESTTWNMSPMLLEEELEQRARLGRLPKAVVVVDLYGQCASYSEIEPICGRYDIPLVEDAAEALGATHFGRPAGSFGSVAAFSFNGNKIITTSGGGMLVSTEPTLVERARHLSTQAKEPAPHYEHVEIGFNYRLSNLLAALGRSQLKTLDDRVARRRAIFDSYVDLLDTVPGVSFLAEAPGNTSTRWLTCCTLEPDTAPVTSTQLREQLEGLDIESRPTWKPMHLQPLFRDAPSRIDGTSQRIFESSICLPSGSGMNDKQLERVLDAVKLCMHVGDRD
jgi:pyridoxal phosphate-dependent aminotransferase EpsN